MESMRVTKNELRGAYKYYGLFYGASGRVICNEFVLKTDKAEDMAVCYDFDDRVWYELDRETIFRYAGSKKWPGELAEIDEMTALWYLEMESAFNGEGDDPAVEAFLRLWTEKKEQYREKWNSMGGWPAKYVKTTFYLKGKQYVITPDSIGLKKGECWDEGFMEYLQGDIGAELKALGAEEVRHSGFLD